MHMAAVKREQRKVTQENQLKVEAIGALNIMRAELYSLHEVGGDKALDAEFWRTQTTRLLEVSQQLIEEHERTSFI